MSIGMFVTLMVLNLVIVNTQAKNFVRESIILEHLCGLQIPKVIC